MQHNNTENGEAVAVHGTEAGRQDNVDTAVIRIPSSKMETFKQKAREIFKLKSTCDIVFLDPSGSFRTVCTKKDQEPVESVPLPTEEKGVSTYSFPSLAANYFESQQENSRKIWEPSTMEEKFLSEFDPNYTNYQASISTQTNFLFIPITKKVISVKYIPLDLDQQSNFDILHETIENHSNHVLDQSIGDNNLAHNTQKMNRNHKTADNVDQELKGDSRHTGDFENLRSAKVTAKEHYQNSAPISFVTTVDGTMPFTYALPKSNIEPTDGDTETTGVCTVKNNIKEILQMIREQTKQRQLAQLKKQKGVKQTDPFKNPTDADEVVDREREEFEEMSENSEISMHQTMNTNVSEHTPSQTTYSESTSCSSDSDTCGPISAHSLEILRSPLMCPDTSCRHYVSISSFTAHYADEHNKIIMKAIRPMEKTRFQINPNSLRSGVKRAHILYMLQDKICDFGSYQYKDYFPLLVMVSQISLDDLKGEKKDVAEEEKSTIDSSNDFTMIWVTSLDVEGLPIILTLSVLHNVTEMSEKPISYLTHSGPPYPIREPHTAAKIFQSGRLLLLSSCQVEFLTHGCNNMLEFEFSVK